PYLCDDNIVALETYLRPDPISYLTDPVLLWLWCGPVAAAPIRPLAWESPYAAGAAQEIAKRQKKKFPLL
ncbi:hypothetical protein PS001_24610, partial [Shigella sonnei]|nr:hypothetical protein [Shigella sonnei]